MNSGVGAADTIRHWVTLATDRGWAYTPPGVFGDDVHRFRRGEQVLSFTRHASEWSPMVWTDALDQRDEERDRVANGLGDWVWVRFIGGELQGQLRMIKGPPPYGTYEMVVTGATWDWDAERDAFVLRVTEEISGVLTEPTGGEVIEVDFRAPR